MASSKRANAAPAAATTPAEEGERGEGNADASATASSDQEVVRHQVRFDATAEIAYHALVEGALDRWHRIVMAIVIVSGTASIGAIGTLFPGEVARWVSALAPMLVVVVSTLDFVFDLPGQARLHRDLKGRMHEILAALETCGDADIPELKSRMQRVYAMQPPSLRYAQALSYNIAVDAMYPREKAAAFYEPIPHAALNPLAWVMRVDRSWLAKKTLSAPSA